MEIRNKVQVGFFAAILIGAIVLNYYILKPYLSVLFLASIFVIVFQPIYQWILRSLKGRRNLSAIISTILVISIILVPIAFFGFLILNDAQNFYEEVASERLKDGWLNTAIEKVESTFEEFAPSATSLDISSYLQSGAKYFVQNLGGIFTGIFTLVFQAFLLVLALFYFFRDGDRFKEQFIGLSPLADQYDKTIIDRLKIAVNAVVRGVLLIAIIQGIATGIGFAIMGVPNAMLLGAVAALAALVPTIGTALIIAPAVIYLFFVSGLWPAVALAIWGVVIVGLVDNILAPTFIERGLKIHPFLILISVLGGLALFGPVGFLAGPVTLTLLFALFDLYPVVIEGKQNKTSAIIEKAEK